MNKKIWYVVVPVLVIGALLTDTEKKPESPEVAQQREAQREADRKAKKEAELKAELAEKARDARLYAISYGQMAVEKTLRDPNSVEWESKAVNLDNNALCYIYRAKNGFGGMNQGYAVIVDGKMHANKSKTFDKYCPSKGNYETY